MNDQTIRVVNELRNRALKSKVEFNAVRFFADLAYARNCLATCEGSSEPALSALAQRAQLTLFDEAATIPAQGPAANEPVVTELQPSRAPQHEAERFAQARTMMNGLAVDAAGLRAFLFVLKLERAGRCVDLLPLLPELQRMIGRRMGAAAAELLVGQVRRRLA